MWLEYLQARLDERADQDLTRRLRVAHDGTAPRQRVAREGGAPQPRRLFCSNDYLGLAAHPALAEAFIEGVRRWGGGSGASPLVSGHSAAHAALAERLGGLMAPHIPGARTLGFCTGYMANLAVLTSLADADTEVFCERLNHASLIDGARLSRGRVTQFPHADTGALQALLAASTAPRKLIVTDAVFSMDGDLAPLPDLLALAEAHDALLVVDDAHGFGVLGHRGAGSLSHFGLRSERLVLVGTLGKAAGLAGAFVAAHPTVTEYLLQTARTFVFSTASPPALEHALLTALDLIEGEEGEARRARLHARIAQLREGLSAWLAARPDLGWRLAPSPTPIQPLIVGGNAEAMALAEALDARGLRVPAIRPPTVPQGTARLRITLCADHSEADVDALLAALAAVAPVPEGAR